MKVARGYMTFHGARLAPFKCKDPSWCPGGLPESCAVNRDPASVGCTKCLPGMYTVDDGTCARCDDAAAAIAVRWAIVVAVVLVLFFAMFWAVGREQVSSTTPVATCIAVLGLTVSAIQALGVFQSMSVRWVEPLSSFFKALGIDGPKPYEFIGFGDIDGPKPYEFPSCASTAWSDVGP